MHTLSMDFNAETETDIPGDGPLVRELVDTILEGAVGVSKKSTQYTPEQLLAATRFYTPGQVPRIQRMHNP